MRRLFVIALTAIVALAFLASDAEAGRRSGKKSTQKAQTIQVKEIEITRVADEIYYANAQALIQGLA